MTPPPTPPAAKPAAFTFGPVAGQTLPRGSPPGTSESVHRQCFNLNGTLTAATVPPASPSSLFDFTPPTRIGASSTTPAARLLPGHGRRPLLGNARAARIRHSVIERRNNYTHCSPILTSSGTQNRPRALFAGNLFRRATGGQALRIAEQPTPCLLNTPGSSPERGLNTPPAAESFGSSNHSAELPANGTRNPSSLSAPPPGAPALKPSLSEQMSSLSLDPGVQESESASSTSKVHQAPQKLQAETSCNVTDEQPRVHEFFSSSVQEALRDAKQISSDLELALREARAEFPEDDDLPLLIAHAKTTFPWKASRSRTIAVLGDSGQGKSSVINSLLNLPGIAHTSDTGSACTSVVTEYHPQTALGKVFSPMNIHVNFYSASSLGELVKELAWSYRQLYLANAQKSEFTSDQDHAKYERESDEAWSALQAAFQHHDGFSAEFLRDLSDGSADRINKQLVQWSKEIKWPSGGRKYQSYDENCLVYDVYTAEECCEKTKALMEDRLWPFTKVIRVYLSSPILDAGIILVDLPGLHDTNLAKVKATQEYLLTCDNILIVSKIARVITDKSVSNTLFGVVARHMPMEWEESAGKKLRLAIVCTEAENINIKTARAEFCGKGKRISLEEMEKLEAAIKTAKTSGDHKQKKAAKRKLEFALISARSAHVTNALQKRYSDQVGGHLNVFCVGNQAYEKFSRKGIAEFVEASGVPRLEQFSLDMTADDRLQGARHFVRSEIPSLLHSVDHWVNGNMPHGAFDDLDRSNIRQHLDNIRSQLPEYAAKLRQEFVDSFEELIMSLWTPREQKWKTSAVDAAKEWEQWRWNSYDAWCKHNGKHSTSAHENVDWNAQIIWKMRMELSFQWETLEEEIPTIFKKLAQSVSKELTWFKDDTILQASATPQRDLLISSVDAIDRQWNYNIGIEEQKLARGLVLIRKRASESNETSYILGEMLGTYRAASAQSGPGIFERQRAYVGGHIRGATLFPNIAIRMTKDVEALAQKTENSIGMVVKQVMERLEYDIKMALKEGELVSGAENSATHVKKVVDGLKDTLEKLPKF